MFFTCLFFNCLIHFCLIRQICSCTRWHILSALGIFPSSNKMLPGPCTWISSRRDIHTLQTRWTMSWLKWTSRKSCYAKVSIHTPDCWSSTNQWPKLQTFFFQLPASRPSLDDHRSLSDSHTMPIAHWHFLEWSQPLLLYSKHPPRCEHPPGRNQLLAALPLQDHENDLHSCATEAIWYHQSTWQLYSWQKQ